MDDIPKLDGWIVLQQAWRGWGVQSSWLSTDSHGRLSPYCLRLRGRGALATAGGTPALPTKQDAPACARAFAAELLLLRINSTGTGCRPRDGIALPAP